MCCNQQVCVELCGCFEIGSVGYQLIIGVDYFCCIVDRCLSVNEYVGIINIYDVLVLVFVLLLKMLGLFVCCLDSCQIVFFVLDWISFGDDWQWLVGGCFVCLDECVYDKCGILQWYSCLLCFLLQIVVVWKVIDQFNVYVSYVCGILLGQEVLFWISNVDIFLLLVQLWQLEVGLKYVLVEVLILGVVVFCILQLYQYVKLDSSDVGYIFVEEGIQIYIGLELIVNGQLMDVLQIVVSVSVLQVCVCDIGMLVYEGYQLVNVLKVCVSVYVVYVLLFVQGLDVIGGWCYVGVNVVCVDGVVCVLDYLVFDVGLCFQYWLYECVVIWNLLVDNVFNCFYWCDIGSSGGDYYLFFGVL